MARPTKLDARLITRIVQNILTGATYEACCVAAGIDYQTFNLWRKYGKAAKEKVPSKQTDQEKLYIEFFEAVERANAELEISLMKSIKAKGKRDWKATSWILQNRFPERYSERREINVNNVEWDRDEWKQEVERRRAQVSTLEG